MARFDRYERLRRSVLESVKRNDYPNLKWRDDGDSFTFVRDKKTYEYSFITGAETAIKPDKADRKTPERGRQFDTVYSPDKSKKAYHRSRNVFISRADGKKAYQIRFNGSERNRIRNGSASWVYGEEIGLKEAMAWSPDSTKLAYYSFDESEVLDFFLTLDETKQYTRIDVEAYPKAGTPNPTVCLSVYDLLEKSTVQVATSSCINGEAIDHYVYNMRWSPDGKEVLFNRTNRRQNVMEFCSANPSTGECRVIVRETSDDAWTSNTPELTWIGEESEGSREFVWVSERNGHRNLYRGSLDDKELLPITAYTYDVGSVLKIDSGAGRIVYTARSGDSPYKMQVHAINLDGTNDKRLTDKAFHHTASVDPTGRRLVVTSENLHSPPATNEYKLDGTYVREINSAVVAGRGMPNTEALSFIAADGVTECFGYLTKPSHFDSTKSYPLIVTVYAGPESGIGAERFIAHNTLAEFGFIVAWFEGRGTSGRGKAFRKPIYRNLGQVEIDDQAAGVRAVVELPYIDGARVGVFGTSYGGYATLMCMLRYPEIFKAGIAASSVTQWTNYDTIYTERYMDTPENNPKGYREGSTLTHAKNLKGRLLLFYGTADNNVHPANSHQLIHEFNKLGKRYEVMVSPDKGHIAPPERLVAEFFCETFLCGKRTDPMKKALSMVPKL